MDPDQSNNTPDLLFTIDWSQFRFERIIAISISDHTFVYSYWFFSSAKSLPKYLHVNDFNRVNWFHLARSIRSHDWSEILLACDTYLCCEHLRNSLKIGYAWIANRVIQASIAQTPAFFTHYLSCLSSIENILKSLS